MNVCCENSRITYSPLTRVSPIKESSLSKEVLEKHRDFSINHIILLLKVDKVIKIDFYFYAGKLED